jgi:hypothetical protein
LSIVLVLAGVLGWRAGIDRRPAFHSENAFNPLVILFYGLAGSLFYAILALLVISVPVILVIVLRRRKDAPR